MIKRWLRKWLSMPEDIRERLDDIDRALIALRADLSVTMYVDEMDPRRKKLSDEIGAKVKAKLIAEDKARKLSTGEPF